MNDAGTSRSALEGSRSRQVRAMIHAARDAAADARSRSGHRPRSGSVSGLAADAIAGYTLHNELHRGGQGVVYRGTQKSTSRTVAIKVMKEGPFAGPRDRARFEREIRILAALTDHRIVAIHDSGSAAGCHYFVMDHVAGMPLDRFLAAREPSLRDVVALFVEICEAVHVAHLLGIVHRDLKPGNILIDDAGVPHVLDFGLARSLSDDAGALDGPTMTEPGQFIGSLLWASPEQAAVDHSVIAPQSDIYSLGVLLFHALTGRYPYPITGGIDVVLRNIREALPTRPGVIRREIDDELETIVLKCLAKEPQRRYESAGALARDLARYLADEPIEAKRDSALYVFRKTLRRYRVPLAVAGVFLVVLAVSTTIASILYLRASGAEVRATANLHASLVAQGRALRRSRDAGDRAAALDALRRAAAIQPTLSVRNEAIAALAVPDIVPISTKSHPYRGYFDSNLERCASVADDGNTILIRLSDDTELGRIAAPLGVRDLIQVALTSTLYARLYDPMQGNRRLELWKIPECQKVFEIDDISAWSRFSITSVGQRLAVWRLDKAIHIYDLQSFLPVQRIPHDRAWSSLAFDAGGRRLALYDGSPAQILDIESGVTEPVFESAKIGESVVWDPQGRWIAGAVGTNIEVWDLTSKRRAALLTGQEDGIVQLACSTDGNILSSFSWTGATVLWDVRNKQRLLRSMMVLAAFGPHDEMAGSIAMEGGLGITRRQLIRNVVCTPLIAWDSVDVTVRASGAFDSAHGILFVAEAIDSGGGVLRAIDAQSGREVARRVFDELRSITLEPGGQNLMATHADGVYRWPLRFENGVLSLEKPAKIAPSRPVDSIALSASGAIAVSGTNWGEYEITEVATGASRHLNCGFRVNCIRISPDAKWVAAGRFCGDFCVVWDVATLKRVVELPQQVSDSVVFAPDGKTMLTSDNEGITVWETGTWRRLGHKPGRITLKCITPDGLIVGATSLATLQLIDLATLSELATLEPPGPCFTWDCTTTRDGTLLAQFTNRNGIAYLWDLRRLRAGLADMGLDWPRPAYPKASAPQQPPVVVKFESD